MEPLPAVLARVGPGVRVDQEVGGEGGTPLEGLAALLAAEGPLAVVDGPGGKKRRKSGSEKNRIDGLRAGCFSLYSSLHQVPSPLGVVNSA